ncbi:MAG: peptidase S24 [Rikenellaceae bacterium]|nr:peptidase S24 [Rikenellaceae bacterium]
MTANSLSACINISPQRFGKYLKDRDPDYDTIKRIVETFVDINPEWLLTGNGNMLKEASIQLANTEVSHKFSLKTDRDVELQSIPLYDIDATAGIVALFADSFIQTPDDYLSIPNLPPCDGAIRVVGNSMAPIIRSGDIVLFKHIHNIETSLIWGEMYIVAFSTEGDEYVAIKYVKKGSRTDTVTLVSENPDYDPKEITIASIRALALVKASVRYNTMG